MGACTGNTSKAGLFNSTSKSSIKLPKKMGLNGPFIRFYLIHEIFIRQAPLLALPSFHRPTKAPTLH